METQKLLVDDEKKTFDNIQLVGFRLGEEIYATDVMKIEEIIRYTEITSVPRTENYVLGVMNLRGKVIPVVDLRIRFNLDKFDFDKDTSIIVVNFDSEYIGFVVDSVTEVMRVTKKMINPNPPLVGTIGQEYILGICRYNEDLVFILDIDRVVFGGKQYKDSNLKKLLQGSESEKGDDKREVQSTENNQTKAPEEPDKKEGSARYKEDLVTEDVGNKPEKEMEKENVGDVQLELKSEDEAATKEEKKVEVKEQEGEKADIDELIKKELEKREKETEELIRKRKEKLKISKEKNNHSGGKTDVTQLEKKEESSEEQQSIDQLMEDEIKKKPLDEEKKNKIKSNVQDAENIDLNELKRAAKNIIEGKEDALDKNISGEIASIVAELRNAKSKYESFVNSIISTRRTLPKIEEHLNDINEITTESTDLLFNVIDSFNHFYEELLIEIDNMKTYVDEGNVEAAIEKLNYYRGSINEYVNLALKIYEALEFEDIAEQKINRILKLVSDVTARFGSILGYIKNKRKTDNVLLSQEEINDILKKMGLE